jgi:hypothetical protein
MSETFQYKGHEVTVEVSKLGHGWSWSYVLDGTTLVECKDRPLRSADLMLAEGKEAAQHHIDRLAARHS